MLPHKLQDSIQAFKNDTHAILTKHPCYNAVLHYPQSYLKMATAWETKTFTWEDDIKITFYKWFFYVNFLGNTGVL